MKKILTLISLILFFVLPLLTIADPPPPPGSGGSSPSGQQPVGAPIDGGLGILLALGLGYGGKKLYDARKKKEENIAEPEN